MVTWETKSKTPPYNFTSLLLRNLQEALVYHCQCEHLKGDSKPDKRAALTDAKGILPPLKTLLLIFPGSVSGSLTLPTPLIIHAMEQLGQFCTDADIMHAPCQAERTCAC